MELTGLFPIIRRWLAVIIVAATLVGALAFEIWKRHSDKTAAARAKIARAAEEAELAGEAQAVPA